MSYMNRVYSPAHHKSFVAQWLENPTGVRNVMGSIPVGAQIFSSSHACDMLITSFLISSPRETFTIILFFFFYHINGRTLAGTLKGGGRFVEV